MRGCSSTRNVNLVDHVWALLHCERKRGHKGSHRRIWGAGTRWKIKVTWK